MVFSSRLQRSFLRVLKALRLFHREVPSNPRPIALIWRRDAVCEVLGDYARFPVKEYDKRMTDCRNPFLLGYDFCDPQYRRDITLWRSVVRPEDRERIRAVAEARSSQAVAAVAPSGRIDVVQDLVGPVVAGFLDEYLGVPGLWPPREGALSFKQFLDTATYMFNLEILTGLTVDDANRAGDEIQSALDALLATRRAALDGAETAGTMIDRLLLTREPNDLVRRILGGTVSGAIAVTFSQALWAIDRLMDLPAAEIEAIRRIVESGNDALVTRYVREASRFKPFPPGLFRRCDVAQHVERGTPYERTVPADGTLIVALTWSAAFDKTIVPDARKFHVGREDREYLLFGTGQHACPAAQPDRPIAQSLMTEMVKALFALPGLRRARGADGFIQGDDSVGKWPRHFFLEFVPRPPEPKSPAVAA